MNDKSDPCPQPQMQPLALCRFVARPATQVEYAGPAIGHQRPGKRMLAPGVQQQLLSCFRDDDDAPELMATRLRERSWDFMVPVEVRPEKNTGTGYTGEILGMTNPPRLCRRNAGAAILAACLAALLDGVQRPVFPSRSGLLGEDRDRVHAGQHAAPDGGRA